jgi:hypothetical protein
MDRERKEKSPVGSVKKSCGINGKKSKRQGNRHHLQDVENGEKVLTAVGFVKKKERRA